MQTLISNSQFTHIPNTCHTSHSSIDFSDETTNDLHQETFIPLTSTNKNRLYSPWNFSVIIKVFGRKMGHQTLRTKLIQLWKPMEDLPLINMVKALHARPWFLFNHFLSVRKWEPKFIASNTQLTYSAI